MRSTGRVILAAAGSGKTTWIAERVGERPTQRAAVTTFTVLNSDRIGDRLYQTAGRIPVGVRVRTWFSFLLDDLVRPYQNLAGKDARVTGIHLASGQSAPFAKKATGAYWFDGDDRVYNDKISEFALRCDDLSSGAVMRRLARLYGHIYVDEVQDLAGYDLELMERILKVGIPVTMVGDPRQATFNTNHASKNRQFRGAAIEQRLRAWERAGLCEIIEHCHSYRCAPEICQVADRLYPNYHPIESRNAERTGHDGVFLVSPAHVEAYLARYEPVVLRHDSRCEDYSRPALNFGASKGLEFARVLVVPTGPVRKWLTTGDAQHVESGRAKLYVATTRAKHSVAFVHDGAEGHPTLMARWTP